MHETRPPHYARPSESFAQVITIVMTRGRVGNAHTVRHTYMTYLLRKHNSIREVDHNR